MHLRIVVERSELLGQGARRGAGDRVAGFGSIDADGQDVVDRLVDDDGHPAIVVESAVGASAGGVTSATSAPFSRACRKVKSLPPKAMEHTANQPQPSSTPATTSVSQCTPSN